MQGGGAFDIIIDKPNMSPKHVFHYAGVPNLQLFILTKVRWNHFSSPPLPTIRLSERVDLFADDPGLGKACLNGK
jgi:hypothetical protein